MFYKVNPEEDFPWLKWIALGVLIIALLFKYPIIMSLILIGIGIIWIGGKPQSKKENSVIEHRNNYFKGKTSTTSNAKERFPLIELHLICKEQCQRYLKDNRLVLDDRYTEQLAEVFMVNSTIACAAIKQCADATTVNSFIKITLKGLQELIGNDMDPRFVADLFSERAQIFGPELYNVFAKTYLTPYKCIYAIYVKPLEDTLVLEVNSEKFLEKDDIGIVGFFRDFLEESALEVYRIIQNKLKSYKDVAVLN